MNDHRRRFTLPPRRYQAVEPSSLPFSIGETVAFVPRLGLCTMCGACEGVCPDDAVVMRLNPRKGVPEPQIDKTACTECGLCVHVCPGFELDLEGHPSLERRDSSQRSPHFGRFHEILRSRSTDPVFSPHGSSGGMVTATASHLLSSGKVDGVVVTRMVDGRWDRTESYIASTENDLRGSQKSKYQPNPLLTILKTIIRGEREGQRFALVGLPCHVEALRLAQRAFPILADRIPWVISIFCSRTPSLHATEFLIREHGLRPEDVAGIDYRSGGHPGHLTIHGQHEDVTVDHLHWSYWGYAFLHFFWPARCFACYDKTGEQADLSFGDNWQQLGTEGLAASSVVVRSNRALELIHELEREGRAVVTNSLTAEEFVADQDLIRKRLMGNRFWWMRRLGRKVPIYYDVFPVERRSLLRTFRTVRHVLMAEHRLPTMFIRIYIRCSLAKKRVFDAAHRRLSAAIRRLRQVAEALIVTRDHRRPPESEYRFVIIGGFGWRDIGDEAMPRAVVRRLRERCQNISLVMLSPDPTYTEAYHRERAVPDLQGVSWHTTCGRRTRVASVLRSLFFIFGALAQRLGWRLGLWPSARTVLDELAAADCLFNVGGGNLNSIIPSELHRKCTLYLAARALGVPVVISGQTIGPLTTRYDRVVARIALSGAELITLRDHETSRTRLADIGLRGPRLMDTGDDALGLPQLGAAETGRLIERVVPVGWRAQECALTVAFNLKGSLSLFKGHGRRTGLGSEIDLFVAIANWLISTHDARVIMVPTDFGSGVDDRVLHREIAEQVIRRDRVACVETELDDISLKALIGSTDVAIGARYHFNVFAASEGVPFLGLASGVYQQTKLEGLAGLLDLNECFAPLDAEFARFEDVRPYLNRVVNDRYRIASALTARVPELIRRSATSIDSALRLVRGRRTLKNSVGIDPPL